MTTIPCGRPHGESKMSTDDYTFEEVIDLVSEEYGLCVKRARELFTDEQAIQSASATMFINATKEKSSVDTYLRTLKEKIAKTNKEAIPSAIEVWKWHFREYVNEFGPRITSAIHYYVSQNMSNEEIEKHVIDRYMRLKEAQKPVDGKEDEHQEHPMKKSEDDSATDKPHVGKGIHIATSKNDFVRSVMESPVFTEPDDEYFSGNAYW